MIGRLRGRVDETGADWLILDVGGVGYLVQASARTLSAAERAEGEMRLEIETQLREDSLKLYGFATLEERDWFRALLGVQGVGARVALAILSALEAGEIAEAAAAQDAKPFTRASGVGPKLAKRLAGELKDRTPDGGIGAALRPAVGTASGAAQAASSARREALSALANLGYAAGEAARAIGAAERRLGAEAATGDLIRESLKELAP